MDEELLYCNGEGRSFPTTEFGVRDGLLVHLTAIVPHTTSGDPLDVSEVPTALGDGADEAWEHEDHDRA